MNEELKNKIKEIITNISKEKNILLDLLNKAGIDSSEDEPCEAIETLISASEELNELLEVIQ